MPINRHPIRFTIATTLLGLALPAMANPDPDDWQSVVAQAEGQTVYWNAWGGDTRTNRYIDWVAEQMQAQYGVDVEHVKLDDTGSSVARVLGEKQAGNHRRKPRGCHRLHTAYRRLRVALGKSANHLLLRQRPNRDSPQGYTVATRLGSSQPGPV